MMNMRGFTLIELAVVIAVVGLLLGALLVPIGTQVQGRNIKETQTSLKQIHQALIGLVITRGRLPCADTDQDGKENRVGLDCVQLEGGLPWQDLGVGYVDAWGRPFRYRVTSEFTYATNPGAPVGALQLDLGDVGDITVDVPPSMTSPAVVVSSGPDGLFDTENNDGDATFKAGPRTSTFDDEVIFLSRPVVLDKLVQVRKLP